MATPVIYKGDTSANIILSIATGYDYTNCTLQVTFNGVRREFTGLVPGGTITMAYTADETAGMPLGTGRVYLSLRNPAGTVRTMPWQRIKVTDAPGEVYDAAIIIDPSQLDIPDATPKDSLGDVKAKMNAILAFLRGGAPLALALCCLGAWAAEPLYCPVNNLPGTLPMMTNVQAYVEGISGVTPGTVTNIANARIDAKVAPWAMSGQPKPEGISPSVVTGIVQSAAVTNAGAVASAKAYADGTFAPAVEGGYLPKSGGSLSDSMNLQFVDMYGRLIVSSDDNYFQTLIGSDGDFYSKNGVFYFKNGTTITSPESTLTIDNTPVVTSNMLNGVMTPALAQKADRAVPSAANNFAALTSSGNLADSTYSPASFAPAVEGGYLPKSGGTMTDDLSIDGGDLNISSFGVISLYDGNYKIYVRDDFYDMVFEIPGEDFVFESEDDYGDKTSSTLTPDNTPVMTLGQADYHIVTASPVTSGQIGNFDITNLTAKTVSCNVSETSGKASDILIWTYGNTAECQMTFTLPSGFTLVGDAADTKASANKKCLFSLVKISNTEVIVSKKEYN